MNGMLNIYKEKGYTSMDVVAKLRGILRERRIGHTGTLDPDAEGVLPVCIGYATKLCDLLTDTDKEYICELLLGKRTDTLDISGSVLEEKVVSCSENEVREAILSFQGEYDQLPPMYSALKVNGQKLCDLARKGLEVERKPRRVGIHEIEILSMELPVIKYRVVCTKGTYIRSLCDDIGTKLMTGGCMLSLVRSKAAGFRVEDSVLLSEVEQLRDENRLMDVIKPVESALQGRKKAVCLETAERLLQNGNPLKLNQTETNDKIVDGDEVLVYHALSDRLCGLFCCKSGMLKPVKIFEL